jgi:hypothetical protein
MKTLQQQSFQLLSQETQLEKLQATNPFSGRRYKLRRNKMTGTGKWGSSVGADGIWLDLGKMRVFLYMVRIYATIPQKPDTNARSKEPEQTRETHPVHQMSAYVGKGRDAARACEDGAG